jgi:hypothetical protein
MEAAALDLSPHTGGLMAMDKEHYAEFFMLMTKLDKYLTIF